MKRGFVQQKDGHWPRSARRSVGIRLPDLAIQVPVSHRVKFLLLVLPILFLLISSFFVGSPFASVDLNPRTSASVADREVIGQIQPPAPAALEEPLQSLQAARPQTDDKHNVALQRLGKDEYNSLNLVTCLNDFDPVELFENSVDASNLSSDVISPEYQEGLLSLKLKVVLSAMQLFGSIKLLLVSFPIQLFMGIRSPLFTLHPQRALAIIDLPFSIVNLWNKLFLILL